MTSIELAPQPVAVLRSSPPCDKCEEERGKGSSLKTKAEEAISQVEIFTKPGCPYTRGLKRKLQHDRTPYVEHNVEADPVTLRRMLELNGGQRLVPTIVVGSEVSVGFHGS